MIPTQASVRLSTRTTMLAMCALLVVSCSDQNATGPIVPEQPPIAGAALLTCTVTTEGVARMECRPSVGQVFAMPGKSLVPAGANASLLSAVGGTIILGGQGTNVQLTSTNIVATATQVTGDVTVQNLIGQALGTADGTTLAPEGVRVFFSSGPNANVGTVTVGNANGTAFFTASDQPYHQYNEILSTNEVSPSKQWVFNLAGGATTFTFGVYVWAPVQYPDGWVDVSPSSDALDLNTGDVTQQLTGTVKNQLGATVVETITWGSADTEVATVDATGLVTAHEAGATTITATAGTKSGSSSITVTGPSLANSTVTSQFNEIARDGVATSVITVQLKDAANANVTIGGRTVVIATDKGTISGTTDNGNGTYTATLTSSTTIETATVTATVDDDALTDNATVNFISTALAAADTYSETVHGNVSVNSANVAPTAFNVLTNDATEFDTQVTGAGWLATPNKTENGGDVTVTAAGTFTYNPPAGFEGTDRFTYTITGGTTANVTLTVSGMLWFVNASAPACASVVNGCGRLSNPFNSLADFNTANNGVGNNPAAGDGVFIFENASSYTGPLNLLATQKAIGQDATASLATLGYATPTSSAALPAINSGNGVFVTIAGADGVNLVLDNTLRGLTIANTAGQGIGGTSFGTLTLGGDVAVNASAQAIALTTGTIAGSLAGVTSTGGTNNVVLTGVAGTSSFGTGALSGATGTALFVTGGVDLTYGGSITSSSPNVGIRVTGAANVALTGSFSYSGSNNAILVDVHTGILNMSGQFNLTAGLGAWLSNADGAYTFNVAAGSGITGGTNGVTIANDADGTFTFGAHFDISGTTGAAFQTTGAAADLSPTVTFNGDITHNGAAELVNLGRLTSGANLTFAGSLTKTSATGFGIVVNTSDGGTVTFSGASKVIQTGSNPAVQIVTAGPTVNFTNGGLALTTTNGAIAVTAAGALNISGNNNTIANGTGTAVDLANTAFSVASGTGNTITSAGRALNLSTVTIGAAGVNYNSVSSSAPATLSAVRLNAVNATNPIVISAGTLAGATTAHTVDILGSSGSFTFAGTINGAGTGAAIHVSAGSVAATFSGPVSNAGSNAVVFVEAAHTGSVTLNNTVTSTSGTGLQFDNADGTYNISPSAATTFGASDAGVDILNGSGGSFTFGANLSISNPTGTAFRVNASAPTSLSYAGTVTANSSRAVEIGYTTPASGSCGSITFSGNLAGSGASASGILIDRCSSGTIAFSGGSKAFSTQTNGAVTISNNGATVNFTGGGLALTTTSGVGFSATGGGTVNVTAGATPATQFNTVTSGTGTAVNIQNTTIGASGVTFRSVSNSGAANGIVLVSTGNTGGFFNVAGNGAAGTGGTIANTTGADGATGGNAVYLSNANNIRLARMQINDNPNHGIFGTTVSNFTLDSSVVNGTNGSSISGTFNESAIHFETLSGASMIRQNTISGGFLDNIYVVNNSGAPVLNRLQILNNTLGGTINQDGVRATATVGTFNITASGNTFQYWEGDAFDMLAQGTASGDLILQNNTAHNTNASPVSGSTVFAVGGGNFAYNISNNSVRGAAGAAIAVDESGSLVGNVRGTIDSNQIGATGVVNSGSSQGSGIFVQQLGAGTSTTKISNNTIRQINGSQAILIQVSDASAGGGNGTLNATVIGNNIQEEGATAATRTAMNFNIGTVAGDAHTACLQVGGSGAQENSITNFDTNRLRIQHRFNTTVRLPGYGGGAYDTAAVGAYLLPRNDIGGQALTNNTSSSGTGGGFQNTAGSASCPQP